MKDAMKQLLDEYPLPSKDVPHRPSKFSYGTAGFRYHSSVLESTVIRVGIITSLRSKYHFVSKKNKLQETGRQQHEMGLMITASHNPECDNGIKLADAPGGDMLDDPQWERWAEQLCNSDNTEECIQLIQTICQESNISLDDDDTSPPSVVHLGQDTRSSSPLLSKLAIRGAKCIPNTQVIDHGLVTTPMLHKFVLNANGDDTTTRSNTSQSHTTDVIDSASARYYHTMIQSYLSLLQTEQSNNDNAKSAAETTDSSGSTLHIDCACGVPYQALKELSSRQYLPSEACMMMGATKFELVNQSNDGPLNHECGAEYVQKQQCSPKIFKNGKEDSLMKQRPNQRWCSFDGDGDRLVYHFVSLNKKFCLLDGDKIAVLMGRFIRRELTFAEELMSEHPPLRFGVVQTAYANGNSTNYLQNVAKVDVVMAKTGTAHVHRAAHDNFDVGVYFEPNGHGTVLFQPKFYELLKCAQDVLSKNTTGGDAQQERAKVALQRLEALPILINQAVGDAISDMLFVEAILYLDDMSPEQWYNDLYQDLPSRQLKVKVKDRTMIQVNDNETRVLQPSSLQEALDHEMKQAASHSIEEEGGLEGTPRCFVRPSGTEDVVRIYAEGRTQAEADTLANAAAQHVKEICS